MSVDWQHVEHLLNVALKLDPPKRPAFLDQACGGDPVLRAEVASLLEAHEQPGIVDRLAHDLAPLAGRVRESAPIAGRTVGQYRILDVVGGGGMGIVYRAVDAKLGRTVALKFLRPRFDADDSTVERFRREARSVASLEHPNICTVHEIGETDDGQLFLVMPLYDGETLQQRIERGPLAMRDALDIAAQIARGLEKAHVRGIVHRDIKPSNIFITTDGVVKVLDFGIAKLTDSAIITAHGPLGTLAYMSPEQARGDTVDHRSDIWSLGAVLYEMLAGVRAFPGNAAAVAGMIQERDPRPVTTLRADVAPGIAALIASALSRDPENRIASAHAFERALHAPENPAIAALPSHAGSLSGANESRLRRRVIGGFVGVALVAVATVVWLQIRIRNTPATQVVTLAPATIAVLPFADRSALHDQEYFSDGITDELIAVLARVQGLQVASRTSAFAYKDRRVDVRTVGAQLGVATVLEGSVRRSADRLRITAQLVSVADGYQLWADSFERPLGDGLAIQEEIAQAIARALRVRLAPPSGVADADSANRSRPDADAYDEYLKGRYAWYQRTESGLHAAVQHFARAAARAPTYARAHAGLADAYAVLGFYDYLPPREAFPKARAAANRAIALDATLAAPRAALGYTAFYYDWNLAAGEAEFERAIALDPNYSTAHQWYANLLTAARRFPEAERQMRRAQEIDPLSLIANAALGWVLYQSGKYDAAVEQCRQTLELDPKYGLAHLWRAWSFEAMNSLDSAIAEHGRAIAASDSGGVFVASLARTLALAGQRAQSESLLRRLSQRADSGKYIPSYEIAKVHAALGDMNAAFTWMDRAYREHSHSMVFLDVDPQLAAMRTDARFPALRARVFSARSPEAARSVSAPSSAAVRPR